MMAKLASRALAPLGIYVWRVFARPLVAAPLPAPAGIELRLAAADELRTQWSHPELEFSEAKASEAFARGEVCVAALDGPRLAAYAWYAVEPAPHSGGLWMDFDRRAVYIFRAFVTSRYRGRGIAPALYRFADRLFLERGRQIALLCIEADNKPSLAAARRSGAHRIGYCAYWHGAGRFFSLGTPGVRHVGFRFYMPPKSRCAG